jgi:hypothetical protein
MNTIAKTFIVIALAAAVLVPRAAAANSIVRVDVSNAPDFERYLPALPANIPWLAADRRAPHRNAVLVPEAPSVSTWMLVPRPVETWPLPIQAAGPAPSFAGM